MTSLAPIRTLSARERRTVKAGMWAITALVGMRVLLSGGALLLERRAAIERERALLVREEHAVSQAPRNRALLERARLSLASLTPRLFTGSDVVTASADLGRYASARAALSGLTLDQTETVLDGTPIPRVSLRARGSVGAIVAFLRAIETGPKLARVDALAITRAGEGAFGSDALVFVATLSGDAIGQIAGDRP